MTRLWTVLIMAADAVLLAVFDLIARAVNREAL